MSDGRQDPGHRVWSSATDASCTSGPRSGHLPALAALIDAGAWGWLETTAGQLHVSAWPSIYTGVGPGRARRLLHLSAGAGRSRAISAFTKASTAGRPSGDCSTPPAAAAPCSTRPTPTRSRGSPAPRCSTGAPGRTISRRSSTPAQRPARPRERLRQLSARPRGARSRLSSRSIPSDTQRRLIDAVRHKAEAALWLMRQGDFDLFMTVFGETHVGAHYCWNPDGDQDLLRALYAELDRAIARLVEAAGPDAAVFVVSGDAIGPNHAGWHLLPEVLARLGYFASAERPRPPTTPARRSRPGSIRCVRCATCCPRIFARTSRGCCRPGCATSSPNASTPRRSTGAAPGPTACRPTSRAASGSISRAASRRARSRRAPRTRRRAATSSRRWRSWSSPIPECAPCARSCWSIRHSRGRAVTTCPI